MVMTLRYFDGWDDINSSHELTWFTTGAWGTPVTGRHGVGQAVTGSWNKSLVGSPWNYMSGGMAFKLSAFPSTFFRFSGSSNTAADITVNPAGNLILSGAGGADLATYTGITLNTGVWYHIGLAVRSHNTLGQTRVWLNGAIIPDFSLDNIDTEPAFTPAQMDSASNPDGSLVTCDDLWLCADSSITGSLEDEFLGDLVVRDHFPQADGEYVDWTPLSAPTRYEEIDEIGPDDDTSYAHDATPGNRMSFNVGPLAPDLASIRAVQLCTVGRYDTTGPHSIKNFVNEIGVTTHDEAAHNLTTQHIGYHNVLELDPVTGIGWTQSGFEAREYGVKDES